MEKPKTPQTQDVEIRRAPKIVPWGLTGALFGVLGALLLFVFIPADQRSAENILGLLTLSFGSLGFGLGLTLAIAVDLLTAGKPKRAQALRSEQQESE